VTTILLGGLMLVGCARSSALPPPAASIPPPTNPYLGNLRQTTPPAGMISTMPGSGNLTGKNPWRPTAPSREWKYVVVHHTATGAGNVDSINASHLKKKDKNGNPWLGIGYHFVIGNGDGMADGAIEPTFRWRTQIQGAHAGSANKDYNERGIGVCLVGNFEKSPPTAAQKKSVKLLVSTLRNEYRIPVANVVGHKDIRASATECPGKFFPMHEVAAGDPGVILGLDSDGVPIEQIASNTRSLHR
jgi:hypothetical protein